MFQAVPVFLCMTNTAYVFLATSDVVLGNTVSSILYLTYIYRDVIGRLL